MRHVILNMRQSSNTLSKRESTSVEFKKWWEVGYSISSRVSIVVEFLAVMQDMLPRFNWI